MPSKLILNNTKVNSNFQQDSIPWHYTDPKPEKEEILGIVLALNASELRVLNIILLLCSRYKLVYAKQQTIALMSKISRGYLNIVLKKLVGLGLIAMKFTGYNKSCWYKTSSWFKDIFIQESLSKKLAIFYFTIGMLISHPQQDITRCTNDLSLLKLSLTKATTSLTTILSKNFKKDDMFEAQHEVTRQVLDLNLKLTIQQQQQISKFHPTVITRAEQRLKTKKNPNDPVSYFFWLCKDEQANPTVAKEVVARNFKKVEEARKRVSAPWIPTEPTPWISKTFDENAERWEMYAMSPEVKASESHFGGYGEDQIIKQRERYYKKLDELVKQDPEVTQRRATLAKQIQQQYPYTKEGIQALGELLGIKQESITTNETVVEQPKTQEKENHSTKSNYDDVLRYREKYKNDPDAIEFLSQFNQEDFEEVLD